VAAFAKQASAATSDGFATTSCIEIVGLVTAFLLGETLIPPYANRALASRTTRISRNGFIAAGIFSVAWFMVMVALGISARSIIPRSTGEDYVLLEMVRSVMPAEGYALLLVVLVSIVMSSLDSLLNAGAVAFTQDIVRPFANVPDTASLAIGRSATIIIAAIAAVGAVAVPSIISGLLICYSIWAPAILPALIIGLWIKRPRPLAGILSMGIGTLVAVIFQFIFPSLTKVPAIITKVPAIIPALGAALLAYVVGHCIEKLRREPST
jgi:SSS family solute:Na+ symporter